MSATTVQSPSSDPIPLESYPRVLLKKKLFNEICMIVYKACGIRLVPGKEELVRTRLLKRLRALGLLTFESYMGYVKEKNNALELKLMVEALTTNKTSFFRENPHFEYMRTSILPKLIKRGKGIRIWSAGCSSGEEPYSIAILLSEEWPYFRPNDLRILATDISTRILEIARKGEYEKSLMQEVPIHLLEKYFNLVSPAPVPTYSVNENIKEMVRIANLNLMASWPMKGKFDLIFCRNVMIYFDNPTQKRLIRRFYNMLVSGGYLMVGHSESLVASDCDFKYIQPATYRKE